MIKSMLDMAIAPPPYSCSCAARASGRQRHERPQGFARPDARARRRRPHSFRLASLHRLAVFRHESRGARAGAANLHRIRQQPDQYICWRLHESHSSQVRPCLYHWQRVHRIYTHQHRGKVPRIRGKRAGLLGDAARSQRRQPGHAKGNPERKRAECGGQLHLHLLRQRLRPLQGHHILHTGRRVRQRGRHGSVQMVSHHRRQ